MVSWYSVLVPRSTRSLGWLAIGIAVTIACLALTGWVFDIKTLESILPHAVAMRVITMLCVLASAIALACLQSSTLVRQQSRVSQAIGVLVSGIGALTVVSYLVEAVTKSSWSWDSFLGISLFLTEPSRMAVISAFLFSIFGLVLLLLGRGTRRTAQVAHSALLPVALMSYTVLVGYLFHVRAFYEWMHLGVAVNTSLAFSALCLAAFCVRPDTWVMQIFTGEEAGAVMARRLLPGLLGLPLVIGWLRIQGERIGLFSSEFGVALVAIAYTVSLLVLVWGNAGAVNRMDRRRREFEERLQQAHELLNRHIDNSPLATVEWDGDFHITRWAGEAEQVFGWSAEEVLGKRINELPWVYEEDLPSVEAMMADMLSGRRPSNVNKNRNVRKDGSVIYCEWYNTAIFDAKGRMISILSQVLDVTEQKQIEQERERLHTEMTQQARLLDAIVENSPNWLAYLDRDLRYLRVNSTYAIMARGGPERLVGRTFAEVFPKSPDIQAVFEQVRDTGEPRTFHEFARVLSQWPEWGQRYFDFVITPVKNDRGEVDGLVISVTDMTDYVRQREQLLAVERARAELAENLNREIAHRTKNNLTMVAGLLLLQSHQQRNPEIEAVLSETVTRLMAFASVQEEMQTGANEWVELLPILRRVGMASEGAYVTGEAVVSVKGEAISLPVKTATNLAVMTNELITNGIKHGAHDAEGKLRVEVELQYHNEMLYLRVWNSGTAVPEDFNFYTSRGMGLQLVGSLIEQYGGSFSLTPHTGGTVAEVVMSLAELQNV